MPDSDLLPFDIAAGETLLRSLRKGDVNRQKMQVKPGALKPGRGDPESLSLIRAAIGLGPAKMAAKEYVHGKEFWGFGASSASAARDHCIDLRDDRATFNGHVEMRLGYEIPPGPPNTPPEMTELYETAMQRLIALAEIFVVHEDPQADSDDWGGSCAD